jgi:endonuclease YncB( thermonuclease family)
LSPRRKRRVRLRRWGKRAKPASIILAILVLALLVYADQRGWLLVPAGDDVERYEETSFLVVRAIDGDTIELAMPDAFTQDLTTRVRLWGIDSPELGREGRPAEPWAKEAAEFMAGACAGALVVLEIEDHRRRDVYDRLLAHVSLSDGTNLSELLLRAGLASADERWRHQKIEAYRLAEEEAKRAKTGLWSDGSPAAVMHSPPE